MVDLILVEVEGCVVMVDCTLLLLERLECCVVDVDRSAIAESVHYPRANGAKRR